MKLQQKSPNFLSNLKPWLMSEGWRCVCAITFSRASHIDLKPSTIHILFSLPTLPFPNSPSITPLSLPRSFSTTGGEMNSPAVKTSYHLMAVKCWAAFQPG